jgi:myo-inositol-1(or 4)-monophosphatase
MKDMIDLNPRLAKAAQAARAAGAELLRQRGRFAIREKGRFDLVTDADVAAQRLIQEILASAFPGDGFMGEEGRAVTVRERTPDRFPAGSAQPNQPVWVVDPLDGTTNYVHDNPSFAVSIGLVINDEPALGVIYDPSRDELFRAARGLGASLNGRPIRCSDVESLAAALLTVGFPADVRGHDAVFAAWRWFGEQTQGLRRTGSSALNMAYIAAGRFDGFFAFQICPWDVAAGMVIIAEAGGRISRADGRPYHVHSGDLIVTSNGRLHDAMLHGLGQAIGPSPR